MYKDTRLPALRVVVAVSLPRHAARVLVCIVLAEHQLLTLAHPICPQERYPVVYSVTDLYAATFLARFHYFLVVTKIRDARAVVCFSHVEVSDSLEHIRKLSTR